MRAERYQSVSWALGLDENFTVVVAYESGEAERVGEVFDGWAHAHALDDTRERNGHTLQLAIRWGGGWWHMWGVFFSHGFNLS